MGQIDMRLMRPQDIQPFVWPDLPKVSEHTDAFRSLLPAQPVCIPLGCAGADAVLRMPADVVPAQLGLRTKCAIGAHDFVVMHDMGVLNRLAVNAGYDVLADTLPEDVLGMIAELLVASIAAPIEEALEGSLRVASTHSVNGQDAPGDAGMPFCIDMPNGDKEQLWLAADANTIALIVKLAGHHGADIEAVPLPNFMVPIRVFGPECSLLQAELDALGSGDGILFEHPWTENLGQSVTIADHFVADLRFADDALRLKQPLTSKFTPIARSHTMPDIDDLPNTSPANLDEMPINVSIELLRTEATITELRGLTTGSVVPFDSDISQDVQLLANGTVFATGELVKLNDKVAVRIKTRH